MATYVLIVRVPSARTLEVGRLGVVRLRRGLYAYVGSARRAADKRIARHLRAKKRLRWHIDYVLAAEGVCVDGVWLSDVDQECATARALIEAGARPSHPRLGSSDCRCAAHLLKLPRSWRSHLRRRCFMPLRGSDSVLSD